MVELSMFLPKLRERITGPLDLTMKSAIRDAAVKFCRESLICRESKVLVDTQAKSYSLTDSSYIKPYRVLRVSINGEPLAQSADYNCSKANCIEFNKSFGDVSVYYSVEPKQGTELIPLILFEDYADIIADGAAATLYNQEGKPWSNPQKGLELNIKFTDGCREAYRFAINNLPYTVPDNPVRHHRFY